MPAPQTVIPVQRLLMRDQICETIRGWIVDGTLRPEEKVSDLDLAGRLGVSRTPVREALQRLEQEGLVRTAPNRWTRISPLRIADAMHLYPIVAALECLAARTALPRFTGAELRTMERANLALARALNARDAAAAARADREFHAALARASGNPELVDMLDGLKMKMRRLEIAFFHANLGRESLSEHRQIIRALRERDVERASRGIETNWTHGLARLTSQEPGQSGALRDSRRTALITSRREKPGRPQR